MLFQKCKTCMIRACCSEVCDDFKKYAKEKYNITIGNDISLKQAEIALGDMTEAKNHYTLINGTHTKERIIT